MNQKTKRSPDSRKILASAFFMLIVLTFCVSAWALAQKQEKEEPSLTTEHVYDTVPPGSFLQRVSQFKVIDDFNAKKWQNKQEGFWRLENANSGPVKIEFSKDQEEGQRSDYAMKVAFDLRQKQRFTLYSSLVKLDMSQAEFLAIKCKVIPAPRKTFDVRIRVGLTDWTGKTIERDITDKCVETKQWNEAALPIWLFKGLDFEQLTKISFSVLNEKEPSKAKLWLDDVAFFGRENLGFESTRDNIKAFPETTVADAAKEDLLKTLGNKKFLKKIGRDTWQYFENTTDKKSGIILDHIKTGRFPMVGVYTSPTNIAMDLMCTVAARELGYISSDEAEARATATLKTLHKLRKWDGFFYNFYETTKLTVTREFVSSIDNAWLAASLIVARQAFTGPIAEDATRLLDGFDFEKFLDPENNHIAIGYDGETKELTPYHYGMLVTEARTMSFIAIGKGDIPRDHWWYLYRTAPEAWDWQNQKPKGDWVKRDGVTYFQGYYTYGEKKMVPSWGGSLFEFLMPTLVITEKKLAPRGLGENNKIATNLQKEYALETKKYPVWGISPAAVVNGRRWLYGEYGVPKLGTKGYPDQGVIAPYVSFLALETMPVEAIKNLRQLLQYDIYGEYGFYDSVKVYNGEVTEQYLVLDQGMSLIAIANYLKDGAIQNYFMKDPIAQKAKGLLEQETFF